MKGCYWAAFNCAPPPAQITLERIMEERVDLYSYVPPPGDNTPISVDPFPVYDLVTMEDESEWVVTQLQKHRSRGASGMREEHQKGLLEEARNR